MSYLIDLREELDEQLQDQIRKFRQRFKKSSFWAWYKINNAVTKARRLEIYHDKIENFLIPNLFDENGDAIYWYHTADPQASQVKEVKANLKKAMHWRRHRGRMSKRKLKVIMTEILNYRLNEYENPEKRMKKLKLLCIVGGSGCGKTLASLHLKYKKEANVICSFTTRPPRETEVEGRDHHFIDIVPDKTEMIAYTHFGGYYYYALRTQVWGPCTVYVIDEKGLKNLRADFGDEYDITTVLIKRERRLRRQMGVDIRRMDRDYSRLKVDESEYDYVIQNDSSKKHLFQEIERIYEAVKEKEAEDRPAAEPQGTEERPTAKPPATVADCENKD